MSRPTSFYFQNYSRPVYYDQMYMGEGRWGTAVKSSTEQLLLLVVHGSCCWFDVPTGSSVVPAGRLIFLLVVSCSYWLTTFPAGFEGY
ncbi:hypothetical protein Tco_0450605 [Tanacetum coccineum]